MTDKQNKNIGQKIIVYAVYHDLTVEERSHEVYQALCMIAKVALNSLGTVPTQDLKNKVIVISPCRFKRLGFLRLFDFWYKTKQMIKKYHPAVVVLHDDAVLIRYVKKYYPDIKIVYDQSELEIDRKVKSFKTAFLKMCDWFTKKDIKQIDLFISANKERGEISKKFYNFKCNTIIFNNMHKIQETDIGYEFAEKYQDIFSKEKLVIIHGGGIAHDRGTFKLIEAVKNNNNLYLIIAGAAWNNLQKYNDMIKNEGITNVKYVGFVQRREWAYILKNAGASVVYYDPDISLNFKFCESGKGYESLFLGVPLICSANPPLISLCKEYRCGVCNNDMLEAINELCQYYEYYKQHAMLFAEKVNYENRIIDLSNTIRKELGI